MSSGIDKITLSTQEYEINKIEGVFGVNFNMPQSWDTTSIPTYKSKTDKVQANSIYFNTPLFNLSVNKLGALIILNPSKGYHEYNLTTTGQNLDAFLKTVQTNLTEIGFNTNLFNNKLSRVDIAKNLILEKPYQEYNAPLQLLRGKRQHTTQYPDGYLIANKQHQAIFYDKGMELINSKASCIAPENFMRAEMRVLKNATVNKNIGVNTLIELTKISPNDINTMYVNYFKNNVFKNAKLGTQLTLDFKDEFTLWNSLKTQYPRTYFKHFIMLQGYNALMSKFNSTQTLKYFFEYAGEHRSNIHRYLSMLDTLRAQNSLINTNNSTLTDKLHEIEHKLIA